MSSNPTARPPTDAILARFLIDHEKIDSGAVADALERARAGEAPSFTAALLAAGLIDERALVSALERALDLAVDSHSDTTILPGGSLRPGSVSPDVDAGATTPLPRPASDAIDLAVTTPLSPSAAEGIATPVAPGVTPGGRGSSRLRMLSPFAGPGVRVGRYVTRGELGRGGMGIVLRAHDPALKREVAVKLLVGADDEQLRRRFAREAAAAARLRHPGIVSVHEVGEHEGLPFIVMDLVRGRSLQAALDADAIAPHRAAEIVRDVARAVEHAHGHGVIHRDLKPANILLDEESGRPLISDFGLATEPEAADEALTVSGQIIGTPHYMAPEQAQGGSEGIGPGTDVYGLGGILYRALAGQPPFAHQRVLALLHAVVSEEPPRVREVNRAVQRDLETIAMRCLEKDPARRYPTAAALADELDRFCRGEPITARPIGRGERALRWARRNPVLAAMTAVLALAIGAGLLLVLELGRRVRAEREAFVAEARAKSERTFAAFAEARGAEVPAGETLEARRARQDRLLAAGLDAVAATGTARALDLQDRAVAKRAFDAAMGCGEVALASEQWSVAASAFEKALATDVDDVAARAALDRVSIAREAAARARRAEIEGILADARHGRLARRAGGHEDALFGIVRYPEAQTVALLGAALDEVSERLIAVTRDAYASAVEPTEDEARAGAKRIEGLEAALDAWLVPGGSLDEELVGRLEAAADRLEARQARRQVSGSRVREQDAFEIVAAAQGRALVAEDDLASLARLCCEALGRIGIREGAIGPLDRHAFAEFDPERASVVGVALCLLGGERAERIVLRMRDERYGTNGPYWKRVKRFATRFAEGSLPTAETAKQYAERAELRRGRGDLAGAFDDFGRAIDLDPKNAGLWINRATVRDDMDDLDGAIADLTRALELAPDEPTALVNRAAMYAGKKMYAEALADYDRVLAVDPDRPVALCGRGSVRVKRGRPEEALADLERSLQIEPTAIATRVWLGRALRGSGRRERARAVFDEAIAMDERSAAAWAGRGHVRLDAGDFDGAAADASRAIDLSPEYAFAWDLRARAKHQKGDLVGARADHDRALELATDDPTIWNARGVTRYASGDHEGAIADLTRAIELDPSSAEAYSNRGNARNELGDLRGAIADYDRAIELDPDHVGALVNRGAARSNAGDHAGGIADLTRALEVDPRRAEALVNRGSIYHDTGDLDRALADLTLAVEIDPTLVAAWTNRGGIRYARGDLEGAAADLKEATRLAPRSATSWSNLGVVLTRGGDLDGALAAFSRAIELAPRAASPWINRASVHRLRSDPESAIADLERYLELDPRDPEGIAAARQMLQQLRAESN